MSQTSRPHVISPDARVRTAGGPMLARDLTAHTLVTVPGGDATSELGAVILYEQHPRVSMLDLHLSHARQVRVAPHVSVLNRLRDELFTSEPLEWVSVEALRPGDLVALHGSPRELDLEAANHAYERAFNCTWVQFERSTRVVVEEQQVLAGFERLVIDDLCVHR